VLDEVEVGTEFPVDVRPHVRVIPQCKSAYVPGILLDHHVALLCGRPDAQRPTLPELMACGLAPIAGKTADSARVIVPAANGELVDSADSKSFAAVVERWSADRQTLHNVRLGAQTTSHRHEWHAIAGQTVMIYETALIRALGENAPRLIATELLAPEKSTGPRARKPTLSICICTTNRPAVLRRCLASIEQGEVLPTEVVVGDDTLDGKETAAVCSDFPFVRYIRGPRRGLCANRNVVIAAAQGDYVVLLDDDSEVTPQFVRIAQELTANSDGRTIFTGDVLEDGVDRVPPSNPTFWGHFGKPLAVMGQCETVHLNSNIFPRSAFDHARFDERIVLGYENMDLCQQMLMTGYRIEYRRELVNLHLPLPRTPEMEKSRDEQLVRARYYTSLKRYMLWQSRPLRAFAYAALAPLHQAAHHLIHRQLSQALVGFSDMSWAVHQALEFRKAARESSPETRLPPDANFPKQ
jgi:GT2 family glycosyltransferase